MGEFVSLVEARYSILSVIGSMGRDCDLIDADGHFATLMELKGAVSEFKDYGLQSLLPVEEERKKQIEDLLSRKATALEFVEGKWCEFANYKTMRLVLEYVVTQWLEDKDPLWFRVVDQMVADDEVTDWDNNDKLLFLSNMTSIFESQSESLQTEYLQFVRGCISADILSLSVLDKWRMDEFDGVTSGKKDALMVLSDLIHELQNKEIKDSEHALWSLTTDEEDVTDLVDGYRCIGNYIGSDHNLLPINSNRISLQHRCPWKERAVY